MCQYACEIKQEKIEKSILWIYKTFKHIQFRLNEKEINTDIKISLTMGVVSDILPKEDVIK